MFPEDGCLPLYTSKDDPLPVASRERRLMRQICCRCSRQDMALRAEADALHWINFTSAFGVLRKSSPLSPARMTLKRHDGTEDWTDAPRSFGIRNAVSRSQSIQRLRARPGAEIRSYPSCAGGWRLPPR
jgi:hypothetical protein